MYGVRVIVLPFDLKRPTRGCGGHYAGSRGKSSNCYGRAHGRRGTFEPGGQRHASSRTKWARSPLTPSGHALRDLIWQRRCS